MSDSDETIAPRQKSAPAARSGARKTPGTPEPAKSDAKSGAKSDSARPDLLKRDSSPAEPPDDADASAEDAGTIASTGTGSGRQPVLEDLQGRQVGEYQLLRRLGRGGMAEVYLAEQTSLRRNVAVKILRADMVGGDDVLIKRFEQEAKAAGALNHPNIIQVYAIGEDNGLHYIAQEYVQGMNLREFINKRGVPDVPVAIHVMRQVAAALEAAADAGIVHRDIKPENIMITRKGKVKVADFGLAQLTQAGERVNLTQVGMTMGTPLYMSPEQVNGNQVDKRSDIYSLGVTCYHMLTGQPPFRGPTAMAIAVKHLKEDAPPLHERRPDVPPVLGQIIQRMMAKDPAQRYQSAQAVSNDLKKLAKVVKEQPEAAAEMSLSAIALPQADAPGFRAPSWFVRHPLAAFILSCLLASSASAGVGWLMRPKNPLELPVTAPSTIPKQNTAAEQFLRAKVYGVDDESAWQAVIEHFPYEKIWVQRAKAQLGLLYLRQHRQEEAEKLFNELIFGGEDEGVKASGYAGKAALESLRGRHDDSQKIIAFSLEPLRRRLDEDTRRLVEETIVRNRAKLGDQVKQGYEDLFRAE